MPTASEMFVPASPFQSSSSRFAGSSLVPSPQGSRAGVPWKYKDDAMAGFLAAQGVRLLEPGQYMDKWRLSREGVTAIPNPAVKAALGFK